MRAASPALVTLLNGAVFEYVDLWTITLSGGVVVRWSGGDVPIVLGDTLFPLGPTIDRSAIIDKMGLEASTMTAVVTADSSVTVGGVSLIRLISRRGLDGATVRLDRAFLSDWSTNVAVGSVLRFAGKVTSVGNVQGNTATITVSSWTVLLNVSMPPDVYQAGCLHTLYDAGCTVSSATYAVAGTVTGASTSTVLATGVASATGYLDQGSLVMTSGAASGASRAIRSNVGGSITLVSPLPGVVAVGDTFTAYPGCDLRSTTCAAKFANLIHFKGTPFVPVPETAVG